MAREELPRARVYRLRGIPEHLDRLEVAELVGGFLPDGSPKDITVASLAPSCDFCFLLPCSLLHRRKNGYCLSLDYRAPLILDDSFYGLTPLNDAPSDQHEYDCVVISGLASHPMGSWQPRGQDKSFMWIRDALPKLVTNIRFILYGYDTALAGSKSFQRVPDLAVSLINELKVGGWTSPSAKPLVFFAHSLGGVVLKQTFVMLAGSGVREESILAKTKGAIFFGVPSQGMRVSDVFTMLGAQPNKDALVTDISDQSHFLPQLERQVSGISYVRRMRLFWSYETQTTPTLVEVNGQYQRSGPETVLVSRQSATGGRCDSDPASTIQIDADHSNMVKFSPGHHLIALITHKLHEVLTHEQVEFVEESLDQDIEFSPFTSALMDLSATDIVNQISDPALDQDFWDLYSIAQSLRPPERDRRLEQIDDKVGHSFEWVFDRPSIGLTTWLRKGDGLFWISGRPASGKSTMMKFLNNDARTWRLLQGWQSKGHLIRAGFFFHHRGNAAQKSFEGLIRSILSQLIESDPEVFTLILPMFQDRYQNILQAKKLGSLRSDLVWLVKTNGLKIDYLVKKEIIAILDCELPRKKFREIVMLPMRTVDEVYPWEIIERAVLARKEAILQAHTEQLLRTMKPPIYREEWSDQIKIRFLSLLAEWRDAVDLRSRLWNLMMLAKSHPPKDANKIDWNLQIDWIVRRQGAREFLRPSIEAEKWLMTRLNQAFSYIIEQQAFDMDLCLFLDALDEYDGPIEFISEFLKDLVKEREESRTRTRILFSSRPWNLFIDEFGNCPGFRIHEHTENDIRELCAQSITSEMPGSREILQLTGEIVHRARGVFLWVKLVLHDLLDLSAKCVEAGKDVKSLRSELLSTLESLPRDLVDYYRAIIERIPPSFRWETYCLLEGVCRSYESVFVDQVPDILRCSTITNFAQLQEYIQKLPIVSEEKAESQLRAVSGGLVEVVEAKIGMARVHQLQLLHQTMLEFVEQPQFKHNILGPMSHTTEENGHSFLTKYLLYRDKCQVTVPLLRHAYESERTTGVSLYSLLRNGTFTITGYIMRRSAHLSVGSSTEVSPIGLAVAGLLHLFIKDALKQDNAAIANAPDSFLSLILWSFDNSVCEIGEAVAMIQFLTSHGFKVENDVEGMSKMILRDDRHEPSFQKPYHVGEHEKMAKAALSGCIDLEMDLPCSSIQPLHSKSLHFSTPELAEYLLERGADPNSVNSAGQTPLDFVVLRGKRFLGFKAEDLYKLCVLLVQRGGMLLESDRESWSRIVTDFQADGFDVSPFTERQFPKWAEKYNKGRITSSRQVIKWPWKRPRY